MFDICDFCGELIEYKLCRATPKAKTVWYSPVDQSHVYAECIPEDQRPPNRFTREVCEPLSLISVED